MPPKTKNQGDDGEGLQLRRAYTVPEVARRYRVSQDRVLGWIRRGELRALNRRDNNVRRRSFVITPEALAAFERGREAAATDAPKVKRRKRATAVDYFPD